MTRFFRALGLAAILAFGPQTLTAAERPQGTPQGTQLTVVELFTSQGCSSCPPADAFLGELAKRDDILALSEHVDYWDYIGWKDTFASPENTKRQRDYARKLGLRYVYTPQMVIQGAAHATGSDRDAVLARIAKVAKTYRVPVSISRDKGQVIIKVPAAHAGGKAAVWLALFDRRQDTLIKRGENAGRRLRYYNVVRNIVRVGTWSGQPLEIPTQIADAMAAGRDGCAVILQSLLTGRILGAARIDLDAG